MRNLTLIFLFVMMTVRQAFAVEPSDAFDYLMKEPVTLMDAGVERLAREMYRVVGELGEEYGVSFVSGGAGFDQESNHLSIYASFSDEGMMLSNENCAMVHAQVISRMGRFFGGDKTGIAKMLGNTFSHRTGNNPLGEQIGLALVEATYFMVDLSTETDDTTETTKLVSRIVCEGRAGDDVLEYRNEI